MGTAIVDGSGDGFSAKVDADLRLYTRSVGQTEMSFLSQQKASAYELHPPRFSNITTTETFLVWMKNTSNTESFYIDRIRLWFNGGNTLAQRATCMIGRFFVGTEQPSANAVTGKFGAGNISHNMNLASTKNPSIDFRYWDNVGSGLTLPNSVKGEQLWCSLMSQGLNDVVFNGSLIVPPGVSIGWASLCETTAETGNHIVVFSGYFK